MRVLFRIVLAASGLLVVYYLYRISSVSPGFHSLQATDQSSADRKSSPNPHLQGADDDHSRESIQSGAPVVTNQELAGSKSPPVQSYPTEESLLEKEFGGFDSADLLKERDRVKAQLDALTREPFQAWYEAGRYDIIGHGNSYSYDRATWNHAEVAEVFMGGNTNGEIRKVTLPEYEFPEFYVMKRKILWLENRADVPR